MASIQRPTLVSEREFLALPESMEHVELVDGEVILSPAPSPWHQELLRRIVVRLSIWAAEQEQAPFVGQSPLDVRFAPDRILQPDALVVLGGVPFDRDGPLTEIPELCVEVLSTNRAYDRLTKRLVYAAAGVGEYWVVEPSGVVERWHGLGLNEAEVVTDTLSTPLLPGFTLDLTALFSRHR